MTDGSGLGVSFWVPGAPAPQGSKRHVGKGVLIESSKAVGPWRERVALVAHQAMGGRGPFIGPVLVELFFRMPRPKSAPKYFLYAAKRPDVDKMARAVLDGITGVVLVDDSQVVRLTAEKELAHWEGPDAAPGCNIIVTELP